MEIIGVYKITNKINNLCYIGISKNINKRWKDHKKYYLKHVETKNNHNKLYNAMKLYGINNFSFEIIESFETLDLQKLKDREIYWISYYDSYNNGYNLTIGGDIGGFDRNGEKHPNSKLSLEDVIDIRTRYNNKERRKEVYELYKHKISESGFVKIWQGGTWKDIMYDVYTEENKKFHKHNCSNKGIQNGRSKLSENDIVNIRLRRKKGENFSKVYEDYSNIISKRYFKNLWHNVNWKDIIV